MADSRKEDERGSSPGEAEVSRHTTGGRPVPKGLPPHGHGLSAQIRPSAYEKVFQQQTPRVLGMSPTAIAAGIVHTAAVLALGHRSIFDEIGPWIVILVPLWLPVVVVESRAVTRLLASRGVFDSLGSVPGGVGRVFVDLCWSQSTLWLRGLCVGPGLYAAYLLAFGHWRDAGWWIALNLWLGAFAAVPGGVIFGVKWGLRSVDLRATAVRFLAMAGVTLAIILGPALITFLVVPFVTVENAPRYMAFALFLILPLTAVLGLVWLIKTAPVASDKAEGFDMLRPNDPHIKEVNEKGSID